MIKDIIIAVAVTFLLSVAIAPFAIKYLISIKFGQSIREIGPSWHEKKSGTPTMGGFIFIIPLVIFGLLFTRDVSVAICLLTAIGFGLVGFIDDYIKVVKKRNLGLSAKGKFMLQVAVTAFFLASEQYFIGVDSWVKIPYGSQIDMGWFYFVFAAFVMLGCVNSVNLTDGIDGLATSISFVVLTFFGIMAIAYDNMNVAILCFASVGGCLAFFLFNKNPAKVFMGDTGSLFLGGLISAVALMLGQPFMLIIAGVVFFAETLSVILQVTYFKVSGGKRLFKMSPIHHHFEMCGWNENKIDAVFGLTTLVMCVVAYFGM